MEKQKRVVLYNLKPSVKTISLRLPQSMLEEIKLLANKHDVPYQVAGNKYSYLKAIEKELSA
ncbi:MAG: CopG family antitoxin [Actinomycetota bacterium]|nr:CopG family antitoxin [Actinomycetota bacterium]